MRRIVDIFLARSLGALALGASLTASASASAPLASNPIVAAVKRGDCTGAFQLVNPSLAAKGDPTTLFLAGRMLDEGICVHRDAVEATQLYSRAADMGDQDAALDYAVKIGLGEGISQSYESAGNICHTAGLDPQNQLSRYALGYACTVGGVAGKQLRETLPRGAFRPGGTAVVEFNPASAAMTIRSTPKVGFGDAPTGSNMRRPMVDAQQVIDKAWRDALAAVPKPDAAQLGGRTIQLPLDVDMTLEAGRNAAQNALDFAPLINGDVHPVFKTSP